MKWHSLLMIYGLLFTFSLRAQSLAGDRKVLSTQNLDYLVTLPEGYTENSDGSPLILFLHGGDRSNTEHHPKKYAEEIPEPFAISNSWL
ncbi:MAG: hypothetical protein Roseis2KO_29210 [Roseivirga sp.]